MIGAGARSPARRGSCRPGRRAPGRGDQPAWHAGLRSRPRRSRYSRPGLLLPARRRCRPGPGTSLRPPARHSLIAARLARLNRTGPPRSRAGAGPTGPATDTTRRDATARNGQYPTSAVTHCDQPLTRDGAQVTRSAASCGSPTNHAGRCRIGVLRGKGSARDSRLCFGVVGSVASGMRASAWAGRGRLGLPDGG